MQKTHYTFFKFAFILSVCSPIFLFGQNTKETMSNDRKNPVTTSVRNDLWGKGGTFDGFTPQQEVVERRTKFAKHFRNADSTFTVQTGDVYHYKDNNGKWQDISLELESSAQKAGYSYANQTNEFKTWFPEKPGVNPVAMELSNTATFNWWNTPRLSFLVNGQTTQVIHPKEVRSTIDKGNENAIANNTVTYPMIYNGISEEFVMLRNGVENNTILHSLTPEVSALPTGATMEFKQFIPLQSGWSVDVNGVTQSQGFNTEAFHIAIPGSENGIFFGKIIVFDHTITKDEANLLVFAPAEKLSAEQKEQKRKHVYEGNYRIDFIAGGIEVSTLLPSDWLKKNDRVFPVTIDPTVTVTPPGSGGNFYGPMTNWYGYQRHADLYLSSEIGISNIIISAIEYNRTSTSGTNNSKPIKIYMNSTTATQLSGTDAWNSSTYTGGLTPLYDASMDLFGTTTGWKMITLTTPFTYTSDNLLVMGYDAYGSGGSAKYLNQASGSAVTARQAYKRQDNTDPGDASATAVEDRLTEIRLTYTNAVACSGTPAAGTISGPTAVCPNVSYTLTLSGATQAGGLTYQWESSPVSAGSFTPIANATNSSYTTTMTGDLDYQCTVTCSNGGASATTTVQTVTMNPYYNCYCTPASNCTNEGIENVTFSTLNNTSTSCNNTSGYTDYSSLGSTATVTQAQVISMSVTAHINSNPASAGVWIDYDHSGTFDASEYTSLGSSPTQASLPATYTFTGNVAVSPTAMTGITRMRVRSANQGGITSGSACVNSGVYGEFEDYLITIDPGSQCTGTPVAGTISGPSSVCSGIDFTLNATGYTNGVLGMSYEWQVYNSGTSSWDPAPGTNDGTSYTATGGITTATDYRFAITCINGGGVDYSPSQSISINAPTQCYCIPATTSNNYYINNVVTTGGAININNTTSGYSAGGYGDFTGSDTLSVPAGANVGMNVTFGSSTTGTYGVKVWIDWGQDGSFSDPGDEMYSTPAYTSNVNASFVIPSATTPMVTRMRVGANYNSGTGPATPCSNFANGEYEDYTVEILPPAACSAPTNLAAANVTITDADLSWDPVAGAVGYEYVIDQTNATIPTGTSTPTSSTSFTTTTLSGATTYYLHVRTDCGSGNYSIWSVISFETLIPNDDAPGAILLTVDAGCTGSPYTNNNATQGTSEPFPNCRGTAGYNTVWYKFVAPASGAVKISNDYAAGTQGGDTKMALFSTTDVNDYTTFTNIACDDDNGSLVGARSIIYAVGLTAGETYYVQISAYSSSSGTGTFCLTVDELNSSMLASSGSCDGGQGLYGDNAAFTGWRSLVNSNSELIANIKQAASSGGTSYGGSITVNSGTVRTAGTTPYLDRNYLLTGAAATADVQLFFSAADFAALNGTIMSGGGSAITLGDLNVTHQTGSTCEADYDAANGTNSVLMQSGNGTANGVNWIQVTTPGFSNFYVMADVFPLAIKLGDISAVNAGTRNRIDWNTATESNGDHFVVERSLDARNFTAIGDVAANGKSSNYTYWDQAPATGINYYRLKMTDAAGKYQYSKVVSATVNNSGAFTMEAFPNPVTDMLKVSIHGVQGADASIAVCDVTGKVLITVSVDSNTATINMSSLPQGIYLLKYADANNTQTIKVNKQ